MIVSIALDNPGAHVNTLTMDDGKSFFSLYPSGHDGHVSLCLAGFDHEAIAHARLLAAALTTAANELEAKLPVPTDAPEPVGVREAK